MFVGRIHIAYIGGLIAISLLSASCLFTFLYTLPEDKMPGRMTTWKARIESFTADEEVTEIPYQLMQSKIAIAKGLVPRGPGNSTQRNFLPHPYSDFIYAIIIEEYGLIGGAFIVFLYLAFLVRAAFIVRKSPKAFGALLAFGLALSLVIQALINMGVTVGILPVTGLTLPLISMGGTSTIFVSIAFGIVLSVSNDAESLQEAQNVAENVVENKETDEED
ncbi:MAG: FtsW/RodA/SpoVE family cell cycle protein [Chitinophagales bacterium]